MEYRGQQLGDEQDIDSWDTAGHPGHTWISGLIVITFLNFLFALIPLHVLLVPRFLNPSILAVRAYSHSAVSMVNVQ